MSSLNKIMIIGRIGKDPETRNLESGQIVSNFSIATSEKWKDKQGNKQESTEWHNIVIWGNLAEIADKYLKKGALVYVEGKLKTRKWEKDGKTNYATEILADTFTMLGQKQDSSEQSPKPSARQFEESDNDLPF